MGETRYDTEAFVSLVTNDNYANGALVLGHSLRRVNTTRKLALLITNHVTEPMRIQLSRVWDVLETVDPLDSGDDANLALLTRPELGITFTKIRCWNLTQFTKCVFLDADTLVLQNCDELFDRQELSAVSDIGWPDCFNSGVFVFEPSRATYEALLQHAIDNGSFDGGDQGLLNSFFSDWATQDIATHLSFIYNMNSNASYTYAPAYKRFGNDVKIVHFIGPVKPWNCSYSSETGNAYMPAYSNGPSHENSYLRLWWEINVNCVLPAMKQCHEERIPEWPTEPYIPYHNESSQSETGQEPHSNNTDQISYHSNSTDKSHYNEELNSNSYSHATTDSVIHQVIDQLNVLHLQKEELHDKKEFDNGRSAWENGYPDYTGSDRFETIQNKLDEAIKGENRDAQDVPALV